MDSVDLLPLIEQLDENIDDLEEALFPLIQNALSETAGQLPLLDKAQLYVLVTYAIESVLFSFLRLNGIDAKEHPVFRELTRVQQYFGKISNAESGSGKRATVLDKPAAGRFIKHALVQAGNAIYDQKGAQQQANEEARTHIRFEQSSNKRKRDDEEASAPDPNSQLIGAADSQSSSLLVESGSWAVQRPDPASSVDANSAFGLEQHETPEELSLGMEGKFESKRRRREEEAPRLSDIDRSGREESISPEKPPQNSAPSNKSFQSLASSDTIRNTPQMPMTSTKKKKKKWGKKNKLAANQAAEQ